MIDNDARTLVALLTEKGLTLSSAESCTGGLVADAIVSVPGSSKVYNGGVIAYTNDVKTSLLGVSEDTITAHTEVSGECAKEMAIGVAKKFLSNIALSTTGYAGPTGDNVGLVYIGCTYNGETHAHRYVFDGDRDDVRRKATREAISIAILMITK